MSKKGVDLEVRCTLIAVAHDPKYEGGEFNGREIAPHDERFALVFAVGKKDKTTGLFTKIPKLAKECYITVEEYYRHDFKSDLYDCEVEEINGNYNIRGVDGIEIILPKKDDNSPLSRD